MRDLSEVSERDEDRRQQRHSLDQCEGCHGIFLDQGEREQIVSAESSYHGNQSAPPPYQEL
jgi:Zn-finger nucleic acid-binding protein